MKIKYLGTAAAEGFPALFCNCEFCKKARELGGKNIRTRSQALIDDTLLLDFPADTYHHFLTNGIEGDKIKYLLITHSHSDHFYVNDTYIRGGAYAHDMRAETLEVFCSQKTFENMDKQANNVNFNIVKAFDTFKVGEYTVTALPAKHMEGGEALFYIIKGDKTLLYAHDTGYFYDEVFSFIEQNGIVFDMISLDCTNIEIPTTDETGHHMGLPNNARVIERLEKIGAVTKSTVKYVNHFSHNGNPLHEPLVEKAKKIGCSVSYDGCVVEF